MSQNRPGVPEVSFEVDQFELLILRVGEKAGEIDPETVKRLQAEHLGYLFQLQSSGKLLAAGAVATRSSGQQIIGLGFFRLGSVEEVQRLSSQDPSVKAGLESAEVVVFMCPKGSFSFPQAQLSSGPGG
jgi:uncharacterized protein YciI